MTTLSANPKPWDVWLAYVRFADHPEVGKIRPVVILENEAATIVVGKITTAAPQQRFSYCELTDWESEGLLKPSRVQAKPLFRISPDDLINEEPLGMLSKRDRVVLSLALLPSSDD